MSGGSAAVAVPAQSDVRAAALASAEIHPAPPATKTRCLTPGIAQSILVVESDAATADVLAEQLARDGYRVELARTAEHARTRARWRPPRLVVLGELDASRGPLALLEEIRRTAREGPLWAPDMPVIVIGRSASELDMLRAFEVGADDFLAPPARYLELRARIKALLRRSEGATVPAQRLTVGPLEIDTRGRTVDVNGRPVQLRRLEFELLVHLAGDPERVFAKHELLGAVWGYRSRGSTRTIDSHASRLRRKLEEHGGRWVVNVWGVGYRLQ